MRTIRIGSGAGYSGDRIEPAIELAEKGDIAAPSGSGAGQSGDAPELPTPRGVGGSESGEDLLEPGADQPIEPLPHSDEIGADEDTNCRRNHAVSRTASNEHSC